MELGTQFYTFTPKSRKPKSFLIKGIKGNFDLDYIEKEATYLRIPNIEVLSVSNFSFDEPKPDSFQHLIHLSGESKPVELWRS